MQSALGIKKAFRLFTLLQLLAALPFFVGSAWAVDTDSDALSDEVETLLGRNPAVPDYLVSAGWNTSCARDDSTTNGQGVQCWGTNSANLNNNTPTFTEITQLVNGSQHACAIDNGSAVCWGSNFDGRATPPAMTNVTQISSYKNHTCAVHDAGVSCWGKETVGQTVVPALNNPQMVSVGDTHSCAIDENGGVNSVICWGSNDWGESTPPALTQPIYIASGDEHNCVIDDLGGSKDIVCWGNGSAGQTGSPAVNNPLMLALGGERTCIVDDLGFGERELVCTGGTHYINEPVMTNIADVSMGWDHTCVLSREGVQCWGDDANGQSDTSNLFYDSDNDGPDNLVDSDFDNDGSGYGEEVLAGTSDADATMRPYWMRTIKGTSEHGHVVSGAGDVNADGYDDYMLLGYTSYNHPRSLWLNSGIDNQRLYEDPLPTTAYSWGSGGAPGGDINNDGYDDFLINSGSFDDGYSDNSSGSVQVYSGADGSLIHELYGSPEDGLANPVGVGDLNGDGYDDFLTGSSAADGDYINSGIARVYSGLDVSIIYQYSGEMVGDYFGSQTAFLGDVNGDGQGDFAVSAGSNNGYVDVYSGSDGNKLYRLATGQSGDGFGGGSSDLQAAGDVNNDGYNDIAMAVRNASPAGAVYVYSGLSGNLLYRIDGDNPANLFAHHVASAGDVNSDGYDDLYVTDSWTDFNGGDNGSAYIFSGVNGKQLFRIDANYYHTPRDIGLGVGYSAHYFGSSLSNIGDIDGDGLAEVMVGTKAASGDGMNGMARIYSISALMNDPDMDFIINSADDDDDNDATLDVSDAFPFDPTEDTDTDGDSVGDNADQCDSTPTLNSDNDGDGCDDTTEDDDDDNDGILDVNDDFPLDASESVDTDSDGVGDNSDNCPNDSNAGQENNDWDAEGDACDLDDDNDGMPDTWENTYVLNPLDASDAEIDSDGDSGSNLQEYQGTTDPLVFNDADSDGSSTFEEALAGTDDNNADERPYWAITLNGKQDGDLFGRALGSFGDLNGDGVPDFGVGATGGAGRAVIYSGDTDTVLFEMPWINSGDAAGETVTSAGDVNNDGYNDILVSYTGDDTLATNGGAVRIFSGADGTLLHSFFGSDDDGQLGFAAAGAGDINGDGYDDIIVGEDQAQIPYLGYIKVFSGADGSTVYTNQGSIDDNFGTEVAGGADINNDGYDDVLVGATQADKGFPGYVQALNGYDGSLIYSFTGDDNNDHFGSAVAMGDVNNDGYADIIVGASHDDNLALNAGSIRVFSGVDGSVMYHIDGDVGVIGPSYHAGFGDSLAIAGDVNGDGYADIVAGSWREESDAGSARVFSGLDGALLFRLYGDNYVDRFGYAVSAADDLDGDGYADLLVGAARSDNNGINSGSVRVFLAADLLNDLDTDFILNSADAFPTDPTESADSDGDGMGDNADQCDSTVSLDSDNDNDGCDDATEDLDDDNDGMPDDWENTYGLDSLSDDTAGNPDGDIYTNLDEYNNGTDPTDWDGKVHNDYTNDGIAGWIWHGTSNGLEGVNRTWSPDWASESPGWVPPLRTYPPTWDAALEYEIVTTGDFNGDGDADWLWRAVGNGDPRWKIWQIEDGFRSGQNNPPNFDANHDWTVVGAGDTDRDGDADVILNNISTGEIMIWEMEDYQVVNTHDFGSKNGWQVVRLGDFDGDADIDFLLQEQGGNSLQFWQVENNGSGGPDTSTQQTGAGFETVCAGDFNGDGNDDVYLLAEDGTSKWFEYVDFVRQQQTFGANQSAWNFLGCGDYDGDGDMDILWSSVDGLGYNRIFINENFNNLATFYTNRYGGTDTGNPGYGFEYRGNNN